MADPIRDVFSRPLKDIRISVTDQCNFRCSYCMPAEIFGPDFAFLPKEAYLSFDEIHQLVGSMAELGVEKVRLTGGEPLLRKDLHLLIEKLYEIDGIKDIALTTNAMMLPKYAEKLKAAGLQRVNVSMDAIDEDVFKKMNGRSVSTKPVLKGIDAAVNAGLEVKINMVVQKGVNDDQIIPMASYFKERNITLRFIEFMDVGSTNGWKLSSVVTKKEIVSLLNEKFEVYPLEEAYYGEVASRYRYAGTSSEVGVISSVSDSFCSTCTRARISADGRFYTCLFATEGFDLKTFMRNASSLEEVTKEISILWNKRKDRYSDERTEETAKNRKKIEMSYIGG
ncbi:GTP 3',8-cyclase MoaA [Jeotgalibacillus campisalis]|uniref:GTP 3',8-cyclase n=1 Tax=Jeotgalibacillus campisalis TaxID=220754 RepID=A0A0C2S534_9BACL|nr:GTP 3',8-cyclase MoaA [Jeotgalibacillus campisalis]KIL49124.1 molybdenum cofactor biosynthesis protein A [Jeotgalibacillus campisalis]